MKIPRIYFTLLFAFLLCSIAPVSNSEVLAAWLPPANVDVCWGAKGSVMRMRFTNMGGGFYQVVGKMTESGGVIGALYGSAVLTSGILHVTATWSGANSKDIWIETARITINRSTLKLTGYGGGFDHDKSSSDPESVETYFGGPHTLPKITCP